MAKIRETNGSKMTGSDRIDHEAERRKLRDYYFAHGIPVCPSLVRTVKAIAHVAEYTARNNGKA
jgi:hypothetical protein